MTVSRLSTGRFIAFNPSTGKPMSAGRVYTYEPGSTNPKVTWADKGKTATNTNPVILGTTGEADIFIEGTYDFLIQDAAGVPVDTIVNLSASIDASDVQAIVDSAVAESTLGFDVIAVSSDTTITAGAAKLYLVDASSGNVTLTLPSVVTARFLTPISFIRSDASANSVTIDGLGAELINDAASIQIAGQWQSASVRSDGIRWLVESGIALDLDSSPTLAAPLDTNGHTVQWSRGADVASAAELLVLTDGNSFDVTGTGTITGIETTADAFRVGSWILLQTNAACTFTHHATNLILPGAADITAAAGDMFMFQKYASGAWRMGPYALASGKAVVETPFISPVKAWVTFNGTGTVAINASDNVSSITDNGVGNYTVNFTTAFADTNYAPVHGAEALTYADNKLVGSVDILCTDLALAAYDPSDVSVGVMK